MRHLQREQFAVGAQRTKAGRCRPLMTFESAPLTAVGRWAVVQTRWFLRWRPLPPPEGSLTLRGPALLGHHANTTACWMLLLLVQSGFYSPLCPARPTSTSTVLYDVLPLVAELQPNEWLTSIVVLVQVLRTPIGLSQSYWAGYFFLDEENVGVDQSHISHCHVRLFVYILCAGIM